MTVTVGAVHRAIPLFDDSGGILFSSLIARPEFGEAGRTMVWIVSVEVLFVKENRFRLDFCHSPKEPKPIIAPLLSIDRNRKSNRMEQAPVLPSITAKVVLLFIWYSLYSPLLELGF